jgi:hypothetical protein
MHTCRPVDLEFLDTAPHRYAAEEIVRATPARIFVTASNLGALTAFAEDYQVTDLGNDRCRVRWVMAIETKGPGAIGLRLFGGALGLGVRFMLKRFRAYVEA